MLSASDVIFLFSPRRSVPLGPLPAPAAGPGLALPVTAVLGTQPWSRHDRGGHV